MTKLNLSGVPNGYVVDANQLLRGGQPTNQGILDLQYIGVIAVVDLYNTGEAAALQSELITKAGMECISQPWSGIAVETQNEIDLAIATVLDRVKKGIVFVHCQHGSDRTGVFCSCWRISEDNWSVGDAIDEMWFELGLNSQHEIWMVDAVLEHSHRYKDEE